MIILLLLLLLIPSFAHAQTLRDEFDGPFDAWINAQTGKRFDGTGSSLCTAATGNGSTDDTTAIQSCLTYLASNPTDTLYFPAGTYKISSTLTLTTSTPAPRVIGHSPTDTTIAWFGSAGQDMLDFGDGLHYGDIARITFNGHAGSNKANAILQDTSTSSGGEQRAYYDLVLENATYGWTDVSSAPNDADSDYIRDTFTGVTEGLKGNANNTVDEWVFFSTFIGASIGMDGQTGNFSSYGNVFAGSTTADLDGDQQGSAVMVNNVSYGSNRFYVENSSTGSLHTLGLVNNRILYPTQNQSVSVGNIGGFSALNNQIISCTSGTANCTGTNTGPPLYHPNGSGLLAHDNQFTISGTNGTNNSWVYDGSSPRITEFSDSQVSAASISKGCPFTITQDAAGNAFTQSLSQNAAICYPTPPPIVRQCYHGGSGTHGNCGASGTDETTASNIQGDITNACSGSSGNRPVVHLAPGTFSLSATLTIPSGCDVQLMGDGWWTTDISSTANPIIKTTSPSLARVSDMQMTGNNSNTAIEVQSEDSAAPNSAHVQIGGIYPENNVSSELLIANGLTNTLIDVYGSGVNTSAGTTGGLFNIAGTGTAGVPSRAACWLCAGNGTSGTPPFLTVTSDGNIVVAYLFVGAYGSSTSQEQYYISDLTSSDSGSIVLDGGFQQTFLTSEAPILRAINFPGNFTSLSAFSGATNGTSGSDDFGDWTVSGSNNVLMASNGSCDPNATVPFASGFAAGNTYLQGCNASNGLIANTGSMSNVQIAANIAPIENTNMSPDLVPVSGVTDTQIWRIRLDNVTNGFDIEFQAATGSVTLSPTSLAFGSQTTGTSSASQADTLTNSTSGTITISSITVPSGFSETNTCGATLATTATCTINVTFSPVSAIAYSGNLSVAYTGATGSPVTAALTGTGIAPTPTPSPSPTPGPASINTSNCYGAVGNSGTSYTISIPFIYSGQGVAVFHKIVSATLSVADSLSNTWTELTGANSPITGSNNCSDFHYTTNGTAGADTLTISSAGMTSNFSAVACLVDNFGGTIDTGNGSPYTASSMALTGTVDPAMLGDLLFGEYHVEGTSPGFSSGSTNSTGTGTPADLTLSGTTSSTGLLVGAATENGVIGNTVGFQRVNTGTNYCGGMVAMKPLVPPSAATAGTGGSGFGAW